MGVFTTSKQFALEIDMPGWWLSGSSVDMDFVHGRYFDNSLSAPAAVTNLLSCSRASTGYAKNSDGTLTSFASNGLRIGVGTGLLVEDARTNLIHPSEDFSTTWTLEATSVTADQVAAPNGSVTMDQINEGSSAGVRHIVYQQLFGITPATSCSFSVFVKDVDRRFVQISAVGASTGGMSYCYADLQSGAITDSGIAIAGTGFAFLSAAIEVLAGGVYRVILNTTFGGADTSGFFICALSDRSTQGGTLSSGNPAYNGASKSLYLWGAQVEQAALFASSYIPTTTTSATRAADAVTTSGNLQSVIAAAAASLVAQTDHGETAGIASNIVDSNGTNLLGFNSSNNALASMTATLATANAGNRTTQDKIGLAWSGAGRSLVLNAGTVATDASAQTPSSTQHVGSSGAANFAYAYIERLTAFNSKLPDATLQSFTQ